MNAKTTLPSVQASMTTKPKQPAKHPVFGVDLSKLEAITEQLDLASEQRRERIEEIKSRGWL